MNSNSEEEHGVRAVRMPEIYCEHFHSQLNLLPGYKVSAVFLYIRTKNNKTDP